MYRKDSRYKKSKKKQSTFSPFKGNLSKTLKGKYSAEKQSLKRVNGYFSNLNKVLANLVDQFIRYKVHYSCKVSGLKEQNVPYIYGVRDKRIILNVSQTLKSLKRIFFLLSVLYQNEVKKRLKTKLVVIGTENQVELLQDWSVLFPRKRSSVVLISTKNEYFPQLAKYLESLMGAESQGLKSEKTELQLDFSVRRRRLFNLSDLQYTSFSSPAILVIFLNPEYHHKLVKDCNSSLIPTVGFTDASSKVTNFLTYSIPCSYLKKSRRFLNYLIAYHVKNLLNK